VRKNLAKLEGNLTEYHGGAIIPDDKPIGNPTSGTIYPTPYRTDKGEPLYNYVPPLGYDPRQKFGEESKEDKPVIENKRVSLLQSRSKKLEAAKIPENLWMEYSDMADEYLDPEKTPEQVIQQHFIGRNKFYKILHITDHSLKNI
jgi:hypothetical protein